MRAEIAIVGAGLMGAATAWQLARRGRSTALIEAYDLGHHHGSSHGSSRIFRLAYPDPFYVRLAARAADGWRELEADTGATLLRTTGGLDTGTGGEPAEMAEAMGAAGAAHEVLTAAQARERWPQFLFDGPVLFHPQAGVINADAAIAACARRAAELGADILTRVRVTGARPTNDGVHVLGERTDDGTRVELTADTLVVAAGAWLPELAARLGVPLELPPLTVTQQEVFHFRQRDPDASWPTFVHTGPIEIFGLPSGSDGGPVPAVKVARYDGGLVTTASGRSGVVDPGNRALVRDYVRRRLPGLDPGPVAEASCLFTNTPDEEFVLDRRGPVVVVSACSGHGAKFAPLIGALAADLALGTAPGPSRFALPPADPADQRMNGIPG